MTTIANDAVVADEVRRLLLNSGWIGGFGMLLRDRGDGVADRDGDRIGIEALWMWVRRNPVYVRLPYTLGSGKIMRILEEIFQ